MASLVNNAVFTAAAAGTGAFGVSAAVTGYQTPAAAGASDTKTYRYRAQSSDLSEWEIGTTVASSTATSFTRVVTASSAGGTTTVNFTNPPTVAITMMAVDVLQFDDAMSLTTPQKATARSNLGVDVATRTITGADTIIASDHGKMLLFNSATAITVAITAVATLGDGFWCRFKNIGAGVVTLDPNSSETIDGQTTIIVPKFDSGEIHCTGAVLHTVNRPSIVLLDSGTVSAAASLSLTLPLGFSGFDIRLAQFINATNTQTLRAQLSVDGSTFATSSYRYGYQKMDESGTPAGGGSASDTSILVSGSVDNTAANGGTSTSIEIDGAENSQYMKIRFRSEYRVGSIWSGLLGWGTYGDYPMKAIKLFFASGNISSGGYTLHGRRRIS